MPNHPIQPVIEDKQGVHRFKENKIVSFILANCRYNLNDLAIMDFADEDHEQLAQLIGYSVCGACDLSYVSDRVANIGMRRSEKLLKELENDSLHKTNIQENLTLDNCC